MYLAAAAGAALHECVAQYPAAYGLFPRPGEWKGQVPKQINQMRAFKKLGIPAQTRGKKETGYCVPDLKHLCHIHADQIVQGPLNLGDWKHVGDAVGLALWAREKYINRERQQGLRANRA